MQFSYILVIKWNSLSQVYKVCTSYKVSRASLIRKLLFIKPVRKDFITGAEMKTTKMNLKSAVPKLNWILLKLNLNVWKLFNFSVSLITLEFLTITKQNYVCQGLKSMH